MQLSTLRDPSGFRVELLDLGARIHRVTVPLDSGPLDAVLFYPEPEAYRQDTSYLGATLGRYANRLAHGQLAIDGACYRLACAPSSAPHCLHGGAEGFSGRCWRREPDAAGDRVTYSLLSADGDQGFPGQLQATVRYSLLPGWRLRIDLHARCDRASAVNLANHAYFNLDGAGRDMGRQQVRVFASRYTPLDSTLVPTGAILDVAGSRLDLRQWRDLRDLPALDDNFLVDGRPGQLRPAASLRSPRSGLQLDVFSTQPALQVYSGAQLSDPFPPAGGLCLEAQGVPDAPNLPPASGLHGGVLRPGEHYRQRVEYRFSRP